jgi:hypothetical protein
MCWQTLAPDDAPFGLIFVVALAASWANDPTTPWPMSRAQPFLSRAASVLGKQNSAVLT